MKNNLRKTNRTSSKVLVNRLVRLTNKIFMPGLNSNEQYQVNLISRVLSNRLNRQMNYRGIVSLKDY